MTCEITICIKFTQNMYSSYFLCILCQQRKSIHYIICQSKEQSLFSFSFEKPLSRRFLKNNNFINIWHLGGQIIILFFYLHNYL